MNRRRSRTNSEGNLGVTFNNDAIINNLDKQVKNLQKCLEESQHKNKAIRKKKLNKKVFFSDLSTTERCRIIVKIQTFLRAFLARVRVAKIKIGKFGPRTNRIIEVPGIFIFLFLIFFSNLVLKKILIK